MAVEFPEERCVSPGLSLGSLAPRSLRSSLTASGDCVSFLLRRARGWKVSFFKLKYNNCRGEGRKSLPGVWGPWVGEGWWTRKRREGGGGRQDEAQRRENWPTPPAVISFQIWVSKRRGQKGWVCSGRGCAPVGRAWGEGSGGSRSPSGAPRARPRLGQLGPPAPRSGRGRPAEHRSPAAERAAAAVAGSGLAVASGRWFPLLSRHFWGPEEAPVERKAFPPVLG